MIHLWVALGALLTIGVEVLFFHLFSFGSKKFTFAAILVNLLSNYALNYALLYRPGNWDYSLTLGIGEILVVLFEMAVYLIVEPKKYELIPLTVAANILSFLVGLGYYGLIALIP
jgi:hypothetical protein